MDLLGALEMLVRSAEGGSFSAAARQLGLTPAAVSKQVARLEQQLKLQLLVRSTRSLALTEQGQRLVREAAPGLQQVHAALSGVRERGADVAGVLKVSLAPAFGRDYVLPLMAPLLQRHPGLRLDWQFENRQVDLIAEGFDAGIAGGVELAGGLVARPLVPLHQVLVASPDYVARRGLPRNPVELDAHDTLALRSLRTGRVRVWQLQQGRRQVTVEPSARVAVSDPEALTQAALCGLGIALAGLPHARPHLDSGALVRVLPLWWADAGDISVYFPHSRLLPAKTRAFVDHLTSEFERQGIAMRLQAGTRG